MGAHRAAGVGLHGREIGPRHPGPRGVRLARRRQDWQAGDGCHIGSRCDTRLPVGHRPRSLRERSLLRCRLLWCASARDRFVRQLLHGQSRFVYDLFELLNCNVLGVAIAPSAKSATAVRLRPQVLHPVGFEPDEGLFDYPARSFLGYRLLTEYFAFPQKFLFLDLQEIPENAKNNLEIVPVRWIDQVLEVALERLPESLAEDEPPAAVVAAAATGEVKPPVVAADGLPH